MGSVRKGGGGGHVHGLSLSSLPVLSSQVLWVPTEVPGASTWVSLN